MSRRANIRYFFVRTFGKLPLKFHYGFGKVVSWFLEHVMHYRQKDILINLARSFPDSHYVTIKSMAHDYYAHIGHLFAETIWFSGCYHNPKRLRNQKIMEVVNQDLLKALYDKAPSVDIFTSHCGNWELFGGICSYNYGDPANDIPQSQYKVVYKQLTHKVSDETFKLMRCSPIKEEYNGMLESTELFRYMLSHKNEKNVYCIIGDQSPYATKVKLTNEFLNQTTYGMLGSFKLATRCHHAAVFAHVRRDGKGHYLIEYETIAEDASVFTPQELMDRYFTILQKDIEADPVNWLWSHKRWKYCEK